MKLRTLVSVLVFGPMVLASGGAMAQADDTSTETPAATDQGTSSESGGTAAGQAEEVPPVEVVQPKPKPVSQVPKSKPKPRPAPRPVSRAPAPRPQPVVAPTFESKIAPLGVTSEGSVMSAGSEVPMSPVQGASLPLSKVPSGVTLLKGTDFSRQGYVNTFENVIQQRVPSAIIGDLQGNEFQTNIQYRGFESSPVNGVPQGLAVYQNGVRINESFSDIVNWDFLPEIALGDIAVVSNNPVYGLNALGGAIVVNMKNGFTYQGGEITGAAGSFGRLQGAVQTGLKSGNWAAYFGGERIKDDGYRDFSPAEVRRMYADLGFKNSDAELHFNLTAADNFVGVTAAAPVQLLDVNWARTFTSPQTTKNKVIMPAFNGTVKINETTNLSGVAYYRHFKQSHDDGNITEAEDCQPGQGIAGTLCIEGEQLLDLTGNPIPDDIFGDRALGVIDRTSQDAKGWGTALQAVNTDDLFGHDNQFLIGGSYDHGKVDFGSSSEMGYFKPKFVVQGGGIFLSAPDDVEIKGVGTENDYYGLYFSDTFNITDRLAFTGGGRYNYAKIQISDEVGNAPDLNGTNVYKRFNPAAGLTYQLNGGMSLYGGYSEANRAPIAAELACADPNNPCLIESFLVSDPPLQQVVAKTWETGIRGEKTRGNEHLEWNLGLFRTETFNDIVTVFSPIAGRGVFENGGNTLRQGVEASVAYKNDRWFTYASYSFIDATYESALQLPSPDNPHASECFGARAGDDDDDDEMKCVFVTPGDHMPGIPEHRFKAGADYWITPKWKLGGDLLAVSSQYFFGDDSNINEPLGGYWKVDLHTSYDLTPRVQVFGLVNNLFDRHYGVFGTFFNLEAGNSGASADPALGDDFFTNARTITPAPPTVAYGGVKIKIW